MKPQAHLFVDGSCGGGQDFGAWAAIVVTAQKRKVLYGSTWPTTISRMELSPIMEGLRWIKANLAVRQPGYPVVVVSDSEYTVKTLCGIYPRKKNMELWTAVDEAAKLMTVKYIWRERNSLPYMEFCDAICGSFRRATINAAIERFGNIQYKLPETDMPYGMLPTEGDDIKYINQTAGQTEDGEDQCE
jgi:ribonuclease HI